MLCETHKFIEGFSDQDKIPNFTVVDPNAAPSGGTTILGKMLH